MDANVKLNRTVLRKTLYRFVLPACLLAVISAVIYGYLQPTPDIASLVPANIQAAGSVDAAWLWGNSGAIRSQPAVAKTISDIQGHLGLSYEADIAPWLGRVTIAKLAGAPNSNEVVLFAQIRNPSAFANMLLKLGTGSSKLGVQMAAAKLDGYQITTIAGVGQSQPIASFTVYKNWLIAGIGSRALKDVFDSWSNGTTLSSKAAYISISKRIDTPNSFLWAIADSNSVKVAPAALPSRYLKGYEGIALFDKGSVFEARLSRYVADDHVAAVTKQFAAGLTPVFGSSLKTVPNDASAALIISSPAHWMNSMVSEYRNNMMPTNGTDSAAFNSAISQMYKVATPISGEVALSGIYSAGMFGAELNATTGSSAQSSSVAATVLQIFTKMGAPITTVGNVWELTSLGQSSSPMIPAMRTVSNNVQLSTNPKWLTMPEGHSGLVMPADATGSCAVLLCSFKDINVPLGMVAGSSNAGNGKLIASVLEQNNLNKASLAAWMNVDSAGRTMTGTVRLSNFDWKAVVNTFICDALSARPQQGS